MQSDFEPVIVLMVDDDKEDIYATKRAFADGKIANDFRYVMDGFELFDYLENRGAYSDGVANPAPHIILLDINLPKKSGLEILAELRLDDRYRQIPVVVLTTSDNDSDILGSYDRGANSFITKPVSVTGMLDIAQHFENYWFQLVKIPSPQKR